MRTVTTVSQQEYEALKRQVFSDEEIALTAMRMHPLMRRPDGGLIARPTLYVWATRGVMGVKLKSWFRGPGQGRNMYTTELECFDFLERAVKRMAGAVSPNSFIPALYRRACRQIEEAKAGAVA